MIYLLIGENSYRALKKIADIKSAFYKKGGESIAMSEVDGSVASAEDILSTMSAGNLFAARRLIVLKHTIESYPHLIDFIKENGKNLSVSRDIFIFWERNFEDKDKHDTLSIFKDIAEKTEETTTRSYAELDSWLNKEADAKGVALTQAERTAMIDAQSSFDRDSSEWALAQEVEKISLGLNQKASTHKIVSEPAQNLIFSFIDKIFVNKLSRALVVFQESKKTGIDQAELLRMLLWKLKNIFLVKHNEGKNLNPYVAKKTSVDAATFNDTSVLDAFWEGILVDSALKRDAKNIDEHIESYMLSMKEKTI